MFYVVGGLHDLLRGGSIVRLLGLPERLLVGVQHRIVELLAGLYALFGDVVMPTLNQRIKDMFNYAGALGG